MQDILSVRADFEDSTQLILGKGSSGFFTSNWLGLGALMHYIHPHTWRSFPFKQLSIQEALLAGEAFHNKLCEVLPDQTLEAIIHTEISLNPDVEDRIAWIHETSGKFFYIKSAYHAIREPTELSPTQSKVFKEIWSNPIPSNTLSLLCERLKGDFLLMIKLRNSEYV